MINSMAEILITEEEIDQRCVELAAQIEADYKKEGVTPILVALLKGSVPFMAELMKRFTIPCEIDFMSVSSYAGTKSLGDVKIDKDMDLPSADRSILLVEDIIDTGRTLKEVKRMLLNKGSRDVKIVTLLDKPEGRVVDIQADYVGFEIPDKFVVGYGLDYNQKYRNLPYIGVLKPEVYQD